MREFICFLLGVAAGYVAILLGAGILVVALVSFFVTFGLMEVTS